jgi:hypothetical protein
MYRHARSPSRLLILLMLPACVIYTKEGDSGSTETPGGSWDGGSDGGADGGPIDTGDPVDTGDPIDTGGGDDGEAVLDMDGDGFTVVDDCDDTNPDVNPGAVEVCDDGLDNNCDGAAVGCALTGEYAVVDVADAIFQGEGAGDRFGTRIASAGDIDADGRPDLLMASRGDGYADQPGVVYLFGSPVSGFVNASAATATITSTAIGDGFGQGLAALGDMNGDGYGDFAVGAPLAGGGIAGIDSPSVLIFSGPMTGGASALTAEATFAALNLSDELGFRLGGSPDRTGDGAVELLVAAPGADVGPGDRAGKVYMLSGPWRRDEQITDAVAVFTGESPNSELGRGVVAGAGDLDGDGLGDVLLTSPVVMVGGAKVGAAYVFTRPASGQVDVAYADLRFYGISDGEAFGVSADGAGDVNGDGYDDLIVGATGADLGARDGGAAYLFHGGAAGGAYDASDADFSCLGARADGLTGASVAGIGDFDGDGNDDIAVSDPLGVDADRLGVVGVLYGPLAGNRDLGDADLLLFSDRVGNGFGGQVVGAGDTDLDLLGELLIGMDRMSPSGSVEAGGAALVRGRGR